MEIEDREQKERERLQKEADQEMEKINFEAIATEEFNPHDPKTRLIGKSSTTIHEWTRPEKGRGKKVDRYTLYWRKKDGNYFTFAVNAGTYFKNIDAETAHDIMNKNAGFQWFLTDAEKKELEEEDERIKGEDSSLQ